MKKIFFLSLLFVLLTPVILFAQGLGPGDFPCSPSGVIGDPDGVTCPLDSWVILFAAGTLIITTLYLRRKKSAALQLSYN
jgi:hypothetical protein